MNPLAALLWAEVTHEHGRIGPGWLGPLVAQPGADLRLGDGGACQWAVPAQSRASVATAGDHDVPQR